MSSDYTTQTPRRSSRGGRRRSRRRGTSDLYRSSERAAPARKPTLWERFLALFKRKASNTGVNGSSPPKYASPASTEGSTEAARSEKTRHGSEKQPRPSIRKPEPVDVTSPRIYVGNLNFDASESDLYELFSGVGLVQNVEIVCNRQTHRSKGFAFVQMQTADEARRAVAELHDKEYLGRKLVVSGAKAQDARFSDRSQQPEQ